MTTQKSSAAVLLDLWNNFADRAEREVGVKPSMRTASVAYLASSDPNILARWTNPAGPRNRFLPISRVVEVAGLLGADQTETDELMMARLAEEDEDGTLLSFATWLSDYWERTTVPDPDHETLSAALRSVLPGFPRGFYCDAQERSLLQLKLVEVLVEAQRRYEADDVALRAEVLEAEAHQRERPSTPTMEQRRRSLAAKMARNTELRKSGDASKLENARATAKQRPQSVVRQAKTYLKGLRSRQAQDRLTN